MFRYIMEFHISLIDELINRLYYHGSFLHVFFLFSTGPYHHTSSAARGGAGSFKKVMYI